MGNLAVMWFNKGFGWQFGTSADITNHLDLKTARLAGWKSGVEVSTPSSSTWTLTNFCYGAFGGIAVRDPNVVINPDGSPYIVSGKVYLTLTVAGLASEGYWGVFTLDLATHELTQVGVLMVERASSIQCDLGGNIIVNDDGTYLVTCATWGNGFGGVLTVLHGSVNANILLGTNVISGLSALTLPTPASPGGAYDASLVRKPDGSWLMAYTVTTDTAFGQPRVRFYPVLASSPDRSTWTLVAQDAGAWWAEGAKAAKIGDRLYVTAGNPVSFRLYDDALNSLGLLDAPFPSTLGNTQPHAAIFESGGIAYNLTMDGVKYNANSFTWGNLYLQSSPGFP